MTAETVCPVCRKALERSLVSGPFRSCAQCSASAGFHMYRSGAEEFSTEADGVCLVCLGGHEPPREGLHCARIVSGVSPGSFPLDSSPPYLDAAPAWMGNAGEVLAASDGWTGLEGALTGLVKGLSRALPGGAVAHVALFDGLDDMTNRPAQLLAVFVVTDDEVPPQYIAGIDGAMRGMALRPQGVQVLEPASPVPIVMARLGVSWRAWVKVQGSPGAFYLAGTGGSVSWAAKRGWRELQSIGGLADGDVRLENY